MSLKDQSALNKPPAGWKIMKLQDVYLGPIRDFGSFSTTKLIQFLDEGIPFVKSEMIEENNINWQSISFISLEVHRILDKSHIHPGNVLFSKIGSALGKAAIYDGSRGVCNSNAAIAKLEIDESIAIKEYVTHFLNSELARAQFQKRIISLLPRINLGDINKLLITIPPVREQYQIVSLVSSWDKAINTLTQLIGQKELRKKWLMQQLLTGMKRLKGFKGEWKEYHLGDFFDERIETNYVSLPLLSIGQSGVYPQSQSDKRDNSNEDKSKYRRICKGDIGYNTMRMWQGRSALSTMEGIVSPAYTILKPRKNADSLFFSYLFKMPKLVNSFFRNSQGLVEDTLNCKYRDFAIVKARLPQREEQIVIAKVLQEAEDELTKLNQKMDLFKTQKKGLMQILLTGKKRLNVNV